jgi:hypothetical protein
MKTVYTNESQFVTLVAASPRWVLRGELGILNGRLCVNP